MRAAELLAEVGRLGIRLEVDGDRLRYWPQGAMTAELAARLKADKSALLVLLQPEPDQFADWIERVDAATGRVVVYDPARHDGRPVWDDGPGESLESRHADDAAAVGSDDPPWPGWLADFVLLLAPDDLPEGLRLDAATLVVDRAKYLSTLRADIRRGARGPRAAVLGEELERLRLVLIVADLQGV